jgi:hypothetical protein
MVLLLFSILDGGAEAFQVRAFEQSKEGQDSVKSPLPSLGPSPLVDQRIQVDLPVPMQDVELEDFAMTEGDATTSGDPTATNPRFLSRKKYLLRTL